MFFLRYKRGSRLKEAQCAALGHRSAVEAGLGFTSLLVVLASVDALGDSCSTVFACVSRASDLFLSRLITERPLMDLPHF